MLFLLCFGLSRYFTTLPFTSCKSFLGCNELSAVNTYWEVYKQNTIFVKDLLHSTEETTVSRMICRCQPVVYRVWLKGMTGTYATHKLALLNCFNRGRQPASWKCCPQHQAGIDLFTHLAYPVGFTYHHLPPLPATLPYMHTSSYPSAEPHWCSLSTQGCLANESKM
jgi:hypothetical protein